MTVGQRIKQKRKELGISADELAKKLGKDRSTIFRYENGEIEKLPIDILDPIADALQTTPKYLMGWEENQTVPQKNSDSFFEIFKKFKNLDEEKQKIVCILIEQLSSNKDTQ